ncbi:MAG TPA: gliding motility-associated C-terminal domain-containing protein, partial [Chitinophagaceae bacterium]|nr:gliding motility-associated C-terminal domain-containing protein [Chitinophagaceae bacterium]
ESFPFTIPDVSPAIDESAVRTTTARCGQPNGSICGIRVRNGVSQQWEDEAGNVVSTSVCFNNARPGKYRLRLDGQGGCTVYSSYYEVPNKVPGVDATAATITHPSCGKDNGSITGIRLFDTDFSTFGWYNDAGVLISTSADLRNAAPGRYKLVVKDNSGACGDSTAFFTLNIVPPPSMNAAAVQVLDASCGNANGSIKGITFSNTTGTVEYWWVNLAGTVVSTTPDLVDAPPGSYRLKMKDKSNCDTLFSPFYDIEDRGGVSLDALAVTVTPTGCKKLSGAIRGITANGADLLEWRNTATGAVVGTGADITSLPEGTYQLTATNTAFGCSVKSAIYTVTLAPPMDLQVLAENVNQASCGLNNGSIEIRDIGNNTAFFTFRWLKDSVVEVGTGLVISDLEPATYHCIATDTNGCEIAFYKKTITALPLPALNENNVSITADTCEFKSGRIAGIVVNSDGGGIQYSWRTLAGVEVATTLQLSGAPAGDYYLFVTDGRGCTIRSRNYNVPAVTTSFTAPRYIAQHNISRNSNLRLQPSGTNRAGTYTLYDRSTGQVVAENTSGVFDLVNVATDRELYVVLITGPCSSQQAIIRIKVFDETNLTIPNAFSPNGDNINDEFRVQVVGLFNLNYLRIFNRYGQMVYETRDLNLPWKGTHNGNPLPVGTYYWLIDGIGMHNKPVKRSGSITLIR